MTKVDKTKWPMHITVDTPVQSKNRRRRRRFVSMFSIRNAVFGGVILTVATAAGGSFVNTRDLAHEAANHADRNEAAQKDGFDKIGSRLERIEDSGTENFKALLDRIDRARIELKQEIQSLKK